MDEFASQIPFEEADSIFCETSIINSRTTKLNPEELSTEIYQIIRGSWFDLALKICWKIEVICLRTFESFMPSYTDYKNAYLQFT